MEFGQPRGFKVMGIGLVVNDEEFGDWEWPTKVEFFLLSWIFAFLEVLFQSVINGRLGGFCFLGFILVYVLIQIYLYLFDLRITKLIG